MYYETIIIPGFNVVLAQSDDKFGYDLIAVDEESKLENAYHFGTDEPKQIEVTKKALELVQELITLQSK